MTGARTPHRPGVALDSVRVERVLGAAVEIVEAAPEDRTFPDRVTESLGICLKFGREHQVVSDGRRLVYPSDALCVRPPGCVWSTATTGDVGFLSADVEASLLPAAGLRGAMTFHEPRSLPDFRSFVRVLRNGAAPLEQETAVAEFVDALVRSAAVACPDLGSAPPPAAPDRVRELLAARLAEPPSLAELAVEVGGNRFVLLRQFRRRFGMPPHAFVVRLRVERARALLARGADIVEIAHELGFADQSHLSRVFKRVVGLSPNAYRRQVRSNHR